LPVQTDRYDVVGWLLTNLRLAGVRAATWAMLNNLPLGRYLLAYDICLNAALLMLTFYDDGGTETQRRDITTPTAIIAQHGTVFVGQTTLAPLVHTAGFFFLLMTEVVI